MNIIKNTKKVYNFGVASEFSKVLLKRAAEKLNPNKVNGSVSNFAKQYLQTFSNWAPSMGISDDLRKYQLPLPVGVYESVPDSAGLTRAEWENKLFDEALKNAIIEINEGITPEVKGVSTTFHFAEEKTSGALDVTKSENKSEPKEQSVEQNDNVQNNTNGGGLGSFIDFNNPAHVAAMTGLTSSAISYITADEKKRKSGEAWKDAAIAGVIGGGAGYVGNKIVNSNSKQNDAPTEQQSQPTTPKQLKPAEKYDQRTNDYYDLAERSKDLYSDFRALRIKAGLPVPIVPHRNYNSRDEIIADIRARQNHILKAYGIKKIDGISEDDNSIGALNKRHEAISSLVQERASDPNFTDGDRSNLGKTPIVEKEPAHIPSVVTPGFTVPFPWLTKIF